MLAVSNGLEGDKATLKSPSIRVTKPTDFCVKFQYIQYGTGAGSLTLEKQNGSDITVLLWEVYVYVICTTPFSIVFKYSISSVMMFESDMKPFIFLAIVSGLNPPSHYVAMIDTEHVQHQTQIRTLCSYVYDIWVCLYMIMSIYLNLYDHATAYYVAAKCIIVQWWCW